MAILYATDRALFKINGVTFGNQIISATWEVRNNASAVRTMTNNRINQVVVLGNVDGTASITETILEGDNIIIDWMNVDLSNAILEVHPASDTFNAPAQQVSYDGQVRLLQILALDRNSESYGGTGNAATRTVSFLLANATYVR